MHAPRKAAVSVCLVEKVYKAVWCKANRAETDLLLSGRRFPLSIGSTPAKTQTQALLQVHVTHDIADMMMCTSPVADR